MKKKREKGCDSMCRKKLRKLGRFGDTSQIAQLVVAPAPATVTSFLLFSAACLFAPVSLPRAFVPTCV